MKNQCIFLIVMMAFVLCQCQTESSTPRIVKTYTIDQFMDNEAVSGSSFSHDEKKILIGSNKTGINNAYSLDIETGERTALTQSTDRTIRPISYFPDDDRILLISDNNGDEIDHLFVREEDGTISDITPYEGAKSTFGGWADDGKSFFFGSNKRNPQFFDIYEVQLEDFSTTLIYENEDGKNVSGMSRDKRYITLTQSVNTNDADLFLLDRETDELKKINTTLASHAVQDFSIDGKKFYYTTDEGAEFSYLMSYEIETGSTERMVEREWDIQYTNFSKSGRYRVSGINEDGKTVLEILDTDAGKNISPPDIGNKEITSVSISESENLMAFYAGGSNAPSDLYLYDFRSGDIKQLSHTLNPEIDGDDLVKAEVIRFKSYDGQEVPGIYYKPHAASKTNKVPALVWVHGGPGGQSRQNYSSLIQYLTNHGYAVYAVNNRGSSGYGKSFYKMDDQRHGDVDLKDVVEAKNYLASLDYIDEENIGIIGGSYGGYMVMRAMTHTPEEFKVGVNIFGVTNWLRTLKSIPPWWGSFKEALYLEMGDPNTADSTRLYDISPLFHADKIVNPVMVLQGSKDPRVLQIESDEMVANMEANGVDVEYVLFEDEGHGFRKTENQIEGWSKILAFLDQRMKEELPG